MLRYLRLLRENPQFHKLWWAVVISLLGDWFSTPVLAGLIVRYSDGSGVAVSLFLALRGFAPFIFTPIAGVLLDRFNRKHILVASNLLRALIVPFYLFAASAETMWVIYVITIIHFMLSTVSEPGQAAILPSLVKPTDIIEGNTLFSVTWSVMLAVGSFVGAVYAYLFGPTAAILADALSFLVAGLLILWIRYDREEARKIKEELNIHTIHERDTSFREGLRYIAATPQILAALFVKFGQSFANADTLMTIFGAQLFVIGATGELSLGALFFALGLGTLIGPIISNRFNDGSVKQMRRLISFGFILAVLGWPFLGWGSSLFIVAIGIFVRGLGVSINWTYSNVIIQKTAPNAKLGRMFSMDMLGYYLASMTSTLAHGWLIDTLGVERISWIVWGTMIVASIPTLIWFWAVQYLEKIEAENPQMVAMAGD
jgi:predicted MFS family arabinose efflux permease